MLLIRYGVAKRAPSYKCYKLEFTLYIDARASGGTVVTWVYDEIGCAGAVLDEFCIRNLAGNTVGWVFGVSVFSLTGEHIGWFEDGVLYDVANQVLGFVPGAKGLPLEMPSLASAPPLPAFSKRPCAPTLRGRTARPRRAGWSPSCLATYLQVHQVPAGCTGFLPRAGGQAHAGVGDVVR